MDKDIYKAVSERSKGCCEVCGGNKGLELHHILRRKVKETNENCIMLCWNCHRGTKGVHGRDGHTLDIKLKRRAQDSYKAKGYEEEKVRELMGGKFYD